MKPKKIYRVAADRLDTIIVEATSKREAVQKAKDGEGELEAGEQWNYGKVISFNKIDG